MVERSQGESREGAVCQRPRWSAMVSRMKVADSRARSSQAKTQAVTIQSKPTFSRVAKNSATSTSP